MNCPMCNKKTTRGAATVTLRVGEKEFSVRVPADVCECGEEFLISGELGKAELAVAGELARSGDVDAAALRFMRKAMGLSARELSALLSTAPETLSRWERGKQPVPHYAAALVGGLVLERLEGRKLVSRVLESLANPTPAKLVLVDVDIPSMSGEQFVTAVRANANAMRTIAEKLVTFVGELDRNDDPLWIAGKFEGDLRHAFTISPGFGQNWKAKNESTEEQTMRCVALTESGDRCREERPKWLCYIEVDERLRCYCKKHCDAYHPRSFRITSAAMLHFIVHGAESE